MSTETKPEVIIPPYEPREPLPGVAPEIRHLSGGYVRGDAHPGVGEPDWRAAAERLERTLSFLIRHCDESAALCERFKHLPHDKGGPPDVRFAEGAIFEARRIATVGRTYYDNTCSTRSTGAPSDADAPANTGAPSNAPAPNAAPCRGCGKTPCVDTSPGEVDPDYGFAAPAEKGGAR